MLVPGVSNMKSPLTVHAARKASSAGACRARRIPSASIQHPAASPGTPAATSQSSGAL